MKSIKATEVKVGDEIKKNDGTFEKVISISKGVGHNGVCFNYKNNKWSEVTKDTEVFIKTIK